MGGGGGGPHVARLNLKTSRVGVHKCFTSLSEIERNFFVFVGVLENGDSDALLRNHYSCAISPLTFRVSNTYTSPYIAYTSVFAFLSANENSVF